MTSSSDRPGAARPSFAERVAAEGDQPRPGYEPMPLLRRASDRSGFVQNLASGNGNGNAPAGGPTARPDAAFVERRRAQAGDGSAMARNPYARFIPREELDDYASWQLDSFGDQRRKPAVATPAPDPAVVQQQAEAAEQRRRAALAAAHAAELRQARDSGYQDGYRDGLAAMEAFKQSHAAQAGAQVAAVVQALQAQLAVLEQHLAHRLGGVSLEIARQVVRSELRTHPEHVIAVAQEALGTLLVSARHITLRLHPQDHALVAHGLAEVLKARGARLVADAQITPGGCLVASDIGVVDARVEARWERASAAQGRPGPFDADASAPGADGAQAAQSDAEAGT